MSLKNCIVFYLTMQSTFQNENNFLISLTSQFPSKVVVFYNTQLSKGWVDDEQSNVSFSINCPEQLSFAKVVIIGLLHPLELLLLHLAKYYYFELTAAVKWLMSDDEEAAKAGSNKVTEHVICIFMFVAHSLKATENLHSRNLTEEEGAGWVSLIIVNLLFVLYSHRWARKN